jgi:hypothetical protein
MGRKRGGIPGLSFSWKRASGLSNLKSQISRSTGVPLTRAGRQRKVGQAAGCCVPAIAILATLGLAGVGASKLALADDEVIYKCTDSRGGTYLTAEAKPGCTVASVRKRTPPKAAQPQALYSSPKQAASSVYYANCSAARAAGAAPVRQGDPGYSRKLDRDGDGVGCE